jgi:hypothetical protein
MADSVGVEPVCFAAPALPLLEMGAGALAELDAPPHDTGAAVAITIAINTLDLVGPWTTGRLLRMTRH